MPVSAGEVEAVLSARDAMSPAMVSAAERVKTLTGQLKELGVSSGATYDGLNAQLTLAKQKFEDLSKGTTTAGQSMNQVEGIAMRLIERMVIMYAIRGTFQFVVSLYEAADALVKMSTATDLSLAKLQMLQYDAEKTGIPFTKIASAIDNLGKALAESKMVTQDTLQSIGLSFAAVFALKPEERFDAIVEAIGAMPDKLERTKAEVKLFGSDAIDPLIMNYASLNKSARESNSVMSDETIQALATATEAYKQFWSTSKAGASSFFAWLIEEEGKAFFNLANFLTGDPSGKDERKGDIPLPKDNKPDFTATSIPQDYIDKLKAAAAGVHALTEEQVKQLVELKELNLLTEDNAAKLTHQGVNIGLNTEQFKRFTAAMKDIDAIDRAAEHYTQAWEKAQKDTEILWEKASESMGKRAKMQSQIADDEASYRAQRDQKENADRLARGVITDTQYFNTKAAIEYKYWQQHNDTLKANETFTLDHLQDEQDKELAILESKYARGLIDEAQYQEQRAAIMQRYASERLSVEDKFNSDMDIRRRIEIDKEIADRKAALAQEAADRKKQTDAEEAERKKKANLDQGGSTDINRGNLDQNAAYWGIPAAVAEAMAARGFSFQEIVAAYQSGKISEWIPHGPRIPGFASGGEVDIKVGEHGPEALRVPVGSTVAKSGYSNAGGVTVNMNVSGMLDPATIRAVTDAVSKEIMRQARLGLPYGSR